MNKFFDKALADDVAMHEDFMQLINQINEDPNILDSLSLEQLVQVNAYYDKECRKLETKISMLEANLSSLQAELEEEGDAA